MRQNSKKIAELHIKRKENDKSQISFNPNDVIEAEKIGLKLRLAEPDNVYMVLSRLKNPDKKFDGSTFSILGPSVEDMIGTVIKDRVSHLCANQIWMRNEEENVVLVSEITFDENDNPIEQVIWITANVYILPTYKG